MRDLYMDILIKRPAIIHDLHSRLIHAVHQVQTTEHDLAVSFPDWRNELGEFGMIFRLFGSNQQILETYRSYVAALVDHDLIRLFPILPVPQTDRKVCFARDQHGKKAGPAALRRRIRRGATTDMTLSAPRPNTHWLQALSSGGHQFQLVIRKTTSERQGGHGYGLGLLVPEF